MFLSEREVDLRGDFGRTCRISVAISPISDVGQRLWCLTTMRLTYCAGLGFAGYETQEGEIDNNKMISSLTFASKRSIHPI
jgi:hypothetical protein